MSKILIVDDDPGICELLCARLQSEQFEVAVASEAMQGINFVHSENPDLVLLDLMMPLGGGIMVLRNMKMSTHTKDIPIIVMSATNDDQLIEQAKGMGIADFIPKPFDADELIPKINKALEK